MNVPLSWHTDIAVLVATGSSVEEHADHLVVRTPANPTYAWGNFVLVTDPATVDDAARWEAVFASSFPGTGHRAIGLSAHPSDAAAWEAVGLAIEHEDVLVRDAPLARHPLPEGYVVRPLTTDDDWEQSHALRLADLTAEQRATAGRGAYERGATVARRRLAAGGNAVFLGAFAGDELAADQGILDCGGGVARHQAVMTGASHRRRGLTSHLLGVASAWAADRGIHTWVILADADEGPGRLYQKLGYTPAEQSSQAYRPAPRS
ncbi:MAG: GNAT family N-acetyltransferase [Nocardioides sp.]